VPASLGVEGDYYRAVATIGVGMLGYAFMGKAHSNAFKKIAYVTWPPPLEPKLVGIAGRNAEAVEEAARRYGFEYATGDWRRLVEDETIGLFDNGGPNALHAEPTIAAARAGKHVVCEKPLGRDAEESYDIWRAVEATGVKHMCAFNYRFVPAVRLAREMVEASELGEVRHFRGRYLQDWGDDASLDTWRFDADAAGSGALGDLMAHVVDLTHNLIAPIARLSGRTATLIPQRPRQTDEGTHFSRVASDDLVDVENEDWAAALVEFEGGRNGSLEASRVAVGPRTGLQVEILGSVGALSWSFERMNELRRFQLADDGDEGYTAIQVGPAHPDYAAFQPGAGVPMGYDDLRVLEARNFLASVRDGEQREPGVEEMLATARVLSAIERSEISRAWEEAR
jgi:predicted dehydrogenase